MSKKIKINEKFRSLLGLIKRDTVSRKELIQLAVETTAFDKIQATRFVARNIHALKSKGLITALGERKLRYYDFSLIRSNSYSPIVLDQATNDLLAIESQVSEEIRVLESEIKTYNEFYEKYPERRNQIDFLLEQAKREQFNLAGRERALKRLIISHQMPLTKADNRVC